MKKLILSLLFVTYATLSLNAQSKIIVREGASGTDTYTSLTAALAASQDGDFLYLPGGVFTGAFTINKNISVIGTGYSALPNSNRVPTIIDNLIIDGVSNLFVSGILINNNIYFGSGASNNVLLSRCVFDNVSGVAVSNLIVEECIIMEGFNYMTNFTVRSSVLGIADAYNSGSLFENCIILDLGNNLWNSNMTFRNNIILETEVSFTQTGNNNFINNVFRNSAVPTPGSSGGGVFLNNVFNASIDSIFSNPAANMYISHPANDYTINPNGPASGAGVNGVDCGVFDGLSPMKLGGIPLNPSIRNILVDPVTDQNGNLQIQATVEAQSR
jgi:hypothetical protein